MMEFFSGLIATAVAAALIAATLYAVFFVAASGACAATPVC